MVMELRDNPKPTVLYVALILCLLPLSVLPFVLIARLAGENGLMWLMLLDLPVVALVPVCLQAAFATEYRIEGDTLVLKCGCLMTRRVRIADIQAVERVNCLPREQGWFAWEGYCNRFGNGLKLVLDQYKVLISPSDPSAFIQALGKK